MAIRPRERRRGINSLLVLMAACVLFFVVFSYQIATRYLFVPGPSSYAIDDSLLWIDASDGTRLAARWSALPGARWSVLYLHGPAEDLGDIEPILANYRLQGLNVLSFDYRGFGLTEGVATEANSCADAESVYEYAIEALGVEEKRLLVHGRSVGAGVAMHLATTREPAGLIVESAYLSLLRLHLPLLRAPGDRFDNQRKAPKVDCPTLVLHGTNDEVVPFSHGEKLATLFPPDKVRSYWFEGLGHENLAGEGGSEYWEVVRSFIRSLAQAGQVEGS